LARKTGITGVPLAVTHGQLEAILVLDHRVVIDEAAIPAPHRGDGEAPCLALGHQGGVIVLTQRAKDISHGVVQTDVTIYADNCPQVNLALRAPETYYKL
jgi:hypothetical protein